MNIKEIEKAIKYLQENPPETLVIFFSKFIKEDQIFHGALINKMLNIKWGKRVF